MFSVIHCAIITICFKFGGAMSFVNLDFPSRERYSFFDTELFQVLAQNEDRNVIMSPVGIKLLLGMLIEGADGQTGEEIRMALRLPKDKEAIRKEFTTWLTLLQVLDASTELKLATQVFVSENHPLNLGYKRTLEKYYRTGISAVNFGEPKEASHVINKWASDQTAGLIPTIVKHNLIAPDTKLMLMSAVYFKGLWLTPFTSEKRHLRCFYKLDNTCKITPMMSDTGSYSYGYISKLDAEALKVPYKGGKYFMLLLLPNQRNKIDELSRDLVHVSMNSILSEIRSQEVFVQIPKFEISFENDFVESLKKLQLSTMFGPRANFSNILLSNTDRLAVHHVFHSARITVNEEGSEAAAATDALFVPLMGGTTTSFIANHPFLFFIMDSMANSIMFAGKLILPTLPEEYFASTTTTTPSPSPSKGNDILNSHISSSKTPLPPFNASTLHPAEDSADSRQVNSNRRGQGPKFRSIKAVFSQNKKLSYSGPLALVPNFYYSTSDSDNLKKSTARNMASPAESSLQNVEASATVNQVKAQAEDNGGETLNPVKVHKDDVDSWRRHILFFS